MVTALSIFSGAGGLDLAAHSLGIDVGLATDHDQSALEVLARAFGSPTLLGDIGQLLLSGELDRHWRNSIGPTLVIGGPPCTPFSHAGFWIDAKRNGLDPSSSLLTRFAEVVELFTPQAFVLENVPGLAFKTHRVKLDGLCQRMVSAGYAVTEKILSAASFGVPQQRRRLFVVGVRGVDPVSLDCWPSFPIRSAGFALDGLAPSAPEPDEVVRGDYGELLKLVPPGRNYLQFTDRYGCDPPLFKNRGRYWSFLLKIDPHRPSPTLPAQRVTYNGPFHWESRHLRVREIARLQGFPDNYPLAVGLGEIRRHLGNAVPPALGMAVLWRVLASLGLADGGQPPPTLDRWRDESSPYRELLRQLLRFCPVAASPSVEYRPAAVAPAAS